MWFIFELTWFKFEPPSPLNITIAQKWQRLNSGRKFQRQIENTLVASPIPAATKLLPVALKVATGKARVRASIVASDDFRTSGTNDLIGGAKDLLCALFRDRIVSKTTATAQPTLQITATEMSPFQSQRLAAQQRHGLCFNLS
jgi:hypothetical protein